MKRVAKWSGWLIYGTASVFVAPLSLWMLCNAQTGVGLALGGLGLMTLVWPVAWGLGYSRTTAVFLLLSLVSAMGILAATPTGSPPADAPLQHRFTGDTSFNRWAIANIVPEIEQVNLGFALVAHLDPIITPVQAKEVRQVTMPLYREMGQDADFDMLGSVMGWAYNQLIGQRYDVGHYYLYTPQTPMPEEPRPALVFLHGSAGNFKTYLWVLAELAEAHNMVVIAPSYGVGNWDKRGGEVVLEALASAQAEVAIDSERIYLAGLSNGGRGVSHTAVAAPDLFRGLIFISPVMVPELVDGTMFQTAWANRPVLIITGAQDGRVPLSYVQNRAEQMRSANIDITERIYPDQDHFLFYAEAEAVRRDISQWLTDLDR